MSKPNLVKKDWEEFRQTGLLWFVNSILHVFGWAITVAYDDETGAVVDAYPARTTFRGFDQRDEQAARRTLAAYLRDNAEELYEEAEWPKTET